MRWMLLCCVVVMGFAWQHQGQLNRLWQQGQVAVGVAPAVRSDVVKVYTIDDCADMCRELLGILREAGVPYREVNLDREENRVERALYLTRGLPRVVDQDHEMIGYNANTLRQWYVERPRNAQRLTQMGLSPAPGEIVLFATSTCPYCAQARRYFDDQGIPFREYNVESDPQARAWQRALVGNDGVPTIIYANMVSQGFSAQSMDALREWVNDA